MDIDSEGRPVPGSSPRMRGKRVCSVPISWRLGLIPAHAGKTVLFEVRAAAARAHPRACGENTIPRSFHRSLSGSSPRMRGKPGFRILVGQPVGLIPAHAGKTLKCRNEQRPKGAHPRACGENKLTKTLTVTKPGSSPRMRGKQNSFHMDANGIGLIPAHAGKTGLGGLAATLTGAHPRACGENGALFMSRGIRSGSSPRMRGKQDEGVRGPAEGGLIPAHAGKTFTRARLYRV